MQGERLLTKSPIQVVTMNGSDKLEPESRLNYAKIYTVEHNIKVHFIGRISKLSMPIFIADFKSTWLAKKKFM